MATASAMIATVLAAVAIGCGTPAGSSAPASIASTPTATAAVDPAQLDEWIAFRRSFGLRADPEWVRHVASLPQSRNDTGVPLLPDEVTGMGKAIRASGAVDSALRSYGERIPSQYAGVVIEGARPVLLMKGDADEHLRVLGLVLPAGSFDVRSVPWSMDDLEEFAGGVNRDAAWFKTIHTELVQAHPSTTNLVRVRYLGANEALGQLILEHFGNPPWMKVEWEGPLLWTGGRGTLTATVMDEDGQPVEGAMCDWIPLDESVDAGTQMAPATNEAGVCSDAYLPATSYRVVVSVQGADGTWREIGEGRGRVTADEVTSIRISAQR